MKLRCALPVWLFVFAGANFAFAAGECADDPDPCFAPRSWIEDFDQDVLVASPGDWQRRNGNSPQPSYANGQATFDGTQNAWTLFDSMDHYFVGTTTVKVQMDENPGGPGDTGAGWWINMDNEGIQGGFYPIFGVLARNANNEQVYRFGQGSNNFLEEIVIAGGPIEAEMILLPPEDGIGTDMGLAYTITDSDDQVFEGFIDVPGRGGVAMNDKWLTLFSMGSGQGVFEYLEVHNQPDLDPTLPCDFDANGVCDIADLDELLYTGLGTADAKYDLDGSGGAINLADRDAFLGQINSFPGDFDLDGKVLASDLNILGGNWQKTGLASYGDGDANGDGIADARDLNDLGGNWQRGAAAASAVPEPTGCVLTLIGFVALLTFRRNR